MECRNQDGPDDQHDGYHQSYDAPIRPNQRVFGLEQHGGPAGIGAQNE